MKKLQGGRVIDVDPFAAEMQLTKPGDSEPTVVATFVPAAVVPDGTVGDIIEWVGDDEDRRRAALAAELAADSPRKSLISRLS